MDTLRKAEILFFNIGFTQLLEIYAGVSLSVQYAYHFPIQMWSKIDAAKSEILALSNDWIWKDEELKLAGIGNPDFLIKDILSDGVFRPFVPEGAIKRHTAKKIDTNDLDTSDNEDEDHVDLFEEETETFVETAKDHAGSQPMINANETQLGIAEGKLKRVAKSLIENWNLRQNKSKLQEATQKAFGQIHDIESADSIEQMVALLQNVVSSLPKNQSESVVVQECYPGFLEWNKHWSESFTHSKIKRPDLDCLQDVHLYYEDWVKKSKESENNLEFQKLWELVMIRSSSEAIYETVGSIMGQHCGKNRYLTPENFSKELVLRFNLGPLHLLNGLIDEVLALVTKDVFKTCMGR